jgi:6-phosphofructokinase 2
MSKKSKIEPVAVLALNPSLDISYQVTQLLDDQKVPSMNTHYEPGGNGINVSQTLSRLDIPVNCSCIIAGKIGEFVLQLLQNELSDLHYLTVEGESRINTTLMQRSPQGQCEVDGSGPEVPETVLEEIEESFLKACRGGFGIMSGSVPPGVPDDTYGRLARKIGEQGGKAVVDAYDTLLEKSVDSKPFLLRVNQYALEMYTRKKLRKLDEVVAITRQFQQDHALNHVCVTFGEYGALLLDSKYTYLCTPPKTHIRSTVGSGDALLAGLVAAYVSGGDSSTALKLGVACGTATTTHSGTGLCSRDEVDRLMNELEVKRLDS